MDHVFVRLTKNPMQLTDLSYEIIDGESVSQGGVYADISSMFDIFDASWGYQYVNLFLGDLVAQKNICRDGCIVKPTQILLTVDLYDLEALKAAEKRYPTTVAWLIDYLEEQARAEELEAIYTF